MAKNQYLPAIVDITPSDVVFSEAADHQRTLSWELNGASWAPPMTVDEYVGRETALSRTGLSANRRTKYYVLTRKDDPDKIVSSCEVTTKKALIVDNTSSRIVNAYAIASVFTAPQYRRHGMAAYLLREVQKIVDKTSECGALYSDIGRLYYTKLGWKDFPSPQLTFALGPPVDWNTTSASSTTSTAGITLLTEDDVRALCETDIHALTAKFQQLTDSAGERTHLAFLPSFPQCAWHFT